MATLVRLLSCSLAGVLMLVLAGAALAKCGGPDLLGGNLGESVRLYLDELERSEELTSRARAVQRCVKDKEQVIAEVCAGRMTLKQAVARFRVVQERLCRGREDGRGSFPAPLDDETLARNVICWVAVQLRKEPTKAARVLGGLRKELGQLAKGA
jgi:hypothetical protein